jgi:hypothetical protein
MACGCFSYVCFSCIRAYRSIRFLLARLHVDSLLDKKTKQKVVSTLEKLSNGAAALDEAYGDAIQRIDSQLPNDRLLAKRAISWITYAKRPLTTRELCHALAIELGDASQNTDNVYDIEDVISVCAGLVIIEEASNVVRLVHYTTQEYFERSCLDWNPSAKEDIASICLTYLSFDEFKVGHCVNHEEFMKRLNNNVFLDYARKHWVEHVRPVEMRVSELALAVFQHAGLATSIMQLTPPWRHGIYRENTPKTTTGLHLSAKFGLTSLSNDAYNAQL